MSPVHLRGVPPGKRMNRKRRPSLEELETLDRIRGFTYALTELARSEDQSSLQNLAVGVLERAVRTECDNLRESVRPNNGAAGGKGR
jgi:hypothetical protein